MNCPNCESELKKIITETHYGATLELNQCFECGGIWCDNLEMYEVSPKTVNHIENLDIKKLDGFTPINKELHCPRCKKILDKFEDPYFPEQIKLEHCSVCGGFWLNRGELAEFKKWQEKKIIKPTRELSVKDKELFEEMNKLMTLNRDRALDIFGKIGEFLDQPIDRTDLPGLNFNYQGGPGGFLISCLLFILQAIFESYQSYKEYGINKNN